MIHIFHNYKMDMTHDEIIHTCRVCGKEIREPWHPVMGWSRPPKIPKSTQREIDRAKSIVANYDRAYEKLKKEGKLL